jgi:hypothetical protein
MTPLAYLVALAAFLAGGVLGIGLAGLLRAASRPRPQRTPDYFPRWWV